MIPFFILVGSLSSIAQQGIIQLPATGQTISYYPGDDGDLQTGVPIPDYRFTDNGDGSLTDEFTGLMWMEDANLIATKDPDFDQDRTPGDGDIDWKTALNYVDLLNSEAYLGYTDWRVPNVVELRSLVSLAVADTAFPSGHPFMNLQDLYWSSTTSEELRSMATCVLLREHYAHANIINPAGETESFFKSPDISGAEYWEFYLLPVRSSGTSGTIELPRTGQRYTFYPGDDGGLKEGIAWPTPRLVNNNNGTVSDRLTGLMWVQDANLMLTKDPDFDTAQWVDGAVPWVTALEYVALLNSENYLGHNDWRMPNRNEMTSLFDCSRNYPAIPERFPFTNMIGYNFEYAYWTSTTRADEPDQAWMVWLTDGTMAGGNKLAYEKTRDWHVMIVRTDSQPLGTSSITGTITLDGNPYPRAEVLLTGPINGFTRTNLNGEFEFNFLPDGNYTVTPTHKYAVFFPESCQASQENSTETCNFTSAYKRAYGWTDISENLFPVGNAAGGCLSGLWFIGEEGWIVNACDIAEIYHTADGGDTWELQEPLVSCNAIYMLSAEEGYAGGESGILCKTTDGGETWNFHGVTTSKILSIGFSPDGSMGWCGGFEGILSEITPTGLIPQSTNYTDWSSISFGSNNYGWAVSCFGRKMIYDDGEWTYYGGAQYFPCYSDIQFTDTLTAWLGYGGRIMRFDDWPLKTFYEDTTSSINGVFTLNKDTVWVATASGTVLSTTNGSEDTVHFSTDRIGEAWLTDIFASDGQHAWAIGNNGSIYRYGILEGFPSNQADLLDVVVAELVQPAIINSINKTAQLIVHEGTDITKLLPEVYVSAGASVYPPSGSMQDFTDPVTYTITSENGQLIHQWTVSCDVATGFEKPEDIGWMIYPNPAGNSVWIQCQNIARSDQQEVQIRFYDLCGKLCHSFRTRITEKDIIKADIAMLPAGTYICSIICGSEVITTKIIKCK